MRGMFSAGVIDVFLEEGLVFDGAVGVSAGATFGCNIKSGQAGRAFRYNRRFAKDPRYGSFRSLFLTGDYYNVDFCYRRIPEELDPFDNKAFSENPMKFYVVATDADTGKPVYVRMTDCREKDLAWIRASASMPVFARPVEIEGRKFMDGGIADSIPLRFMEHRGYERNVCVLTRPLGYRKTDSSLQPVIDWMMREYPVLAEAMRKRPVRYNRTLDYIKEREEAGAVFVIRPPETLPVSRLEHDPEKLEKAYRTGVREARRRLPALRLFFEGDRGTVPLSCKSRNIKDRSGINEKTGLQRSHQAGEESAGSR